MAVLLRSPVLTLTCALTRPCAVSTLQRRQGTCLKTCDQAAYQSHPTSLPLSNNHRRQILHATAPSSSSATGDCDVLSWVAQDGGEAVHDLAVRIEVLPNGGGRGLVAVRDIQPDEVILSVPFTKIFTAREDAELHWAADMSVRLLTEVHASSQGGGASPWAPWIHSLPRHVSTPIEFTDAELDLFCDEDLKAETKAMQQCMWDCFQVAETQLEPLGYGWGDFLWGVQAMTSRCFFDPLSQQHLEVPGVDMANHSFSPSARISLCMSPDTCQGTAALEDVAPPPSGPPPSPLLQLTAGDDGISAGEQVSICYGAHWPTEPFALLFGFAPAGRCPGEEVCLYAGLRPLADHYLRVLQRRGALPGAAAAGLRAHVMQALGLVDEGGQEGDERMRLCGSGRGLDEQLASVVRDVASVVVAHAAHVSHVAPHVDPPTNASRDDGLLVIGAGELAADRAAELLQRQHQYEQQQNQHEPPPQQQQQQQQFPLPASGAAAVDVEVHCSAALTMAAQYRANKAAALHALLAYLKRAGVPATSAGPLGVEPRRGPREHDLPLMEGR